MGNTTWYLWYTWYIMLNIIYSLIPAVVFFQVEGDVKQSEQAQLLVKVSLGSETLGVPR